MGLLRTAMWLISPRTFGTFDPGRIEKHTVNRSSPLPVTLEVTPGYSQRVAHLAVRPLGQTPPASARIRGSNLAKPKQGAAISNVSPTTAGHPGTIWYYRFV